MKYYPQWKPGTPCPNNAMVICPDHSKCSKCGWDPVVSAKRAEELQKKRRSEK